MAPAAGKAVDAAPPPPIVQDREPDRAATSSHSVDDRVDGRVDSHNATVADVDAIPSAKAAASGVGNGAEAKIIAEGLSARKAGLRSQPSDDTERLLSVMAAGSPPASRRPSNMDQLDWKVRHPSALVDFDSLAGNMKGKQLAVFLDYDGTLSPIVPNPDEAFMSSEMRDAVAAVAARVPTAIISGRGLEKVTGFVQLPSVLYAGSHGLDIAGPATTKRFQPAREWEAVMDSVFAELTVALRGITGSSVEHNKFCVSVHYRQVAEGEWKDVASVVRRIVDAQCARSGGLPLRTTAGRKVLEVRPHMEWNKGTALAWLLDAQGLGGAKSIAKDSGRVGNGTEGDDDCGVHSATDDVTTGAAAAAAATAGEEAGRGEDRQAVREEQPGVAASPAGERQETKSGIVNGEENSAEAFQQVWPLYIGDDKTDEDAFRVLLERGMGSGILVSATAKDTLATYTLRDPAEVLLFLRRLVQWLSAPSTVA